MKIRMYVLLILLIFILPLNSIVWDEGVSIELAGADSNLYTITTVRNGMMQPIYISPDADCSNAMRIQRTLLDGVWTTTCKSVSGGTNDTENFKVLGTQSSADNDYVNEAKFTIEASINSASVNVSSVANRKVSELFPFLSSFGALTFCIYCVNATTGKITKTSRTALSITLAFTDTNMFNCYTGVCQMRGTYIFSFPENLRTSGSRDEIIGAYSIEEGINIEF